jgi:hypothetical protein
MKPDPRPGASREHDAWLRAAVARAAKKIPDDDRRPLLPEQCRAVLRGERYCVLAVGHRAPCRPAQSMET